MDEQPGPAAERPAPMSGVPFGPQFFQQVLPDRVRAMCDGQPEQVPVVQLHLADGTAPDLCHVSTLEPAWFAADVFRDHETCEDMDMVFVPYSLVMRVTVSLRHRSQRAAGFELPPHMREVKS